MKQKRCIKLNFSYPLPLFLEAWSLAFITFYNLFPSNTFITGYNGKTKDTLKKKDINEKDSANTDHLPGESMLVL